MTVQLIKPYTHSWGDWERTYPEGWVMDVDAVLGAKLIRDGFAVAVDEKLSTGWKKNNPADSTEEE